MLRCLDEADLVMNMDWEADLVTCIDWEADFVTFIDFRFPDRVRLWAIRLAS